MVDKNEDEDREKQKDRFWVTGRNQEEKKTRNRRREMYRKREFGGFGEFPTLLLNSLIKAAIWNLF